MVSSPSKSDIRSAAGSIADKAGHASDDIAQSSSRTFDQAKAGLDDAGGGLYAKGLQHGRDILNEMPASLSDISAAGERVVRRGGQGLSYGLRKQPVEALLLAGAIGYLVGWASSRG